MEQDRATTELSERDPRFASDKAAWQAVLADPALAIVPEALLQDMSATDHAIAVGDRFTVINPTSGDEHILTAAGIVESEWVFNRVMVRADSVSGYAGTVSASRAYVAVEPSANPEVVADTLTARLIPNGVDAQTFTQIIDDVLVENERFFQLLEGFLALGLAIGIAGLGVVMVRAVRERRRQIGMLRALGMQARTVRAAFLIEASFIALQGVVIGVVLGLVTAWSLLSHSDAFGDDPIQFQVPWVALAILVVATLGASLLAVYGPSAQATRVKPAVALRIADRTAVAHARVQARQAWAVEPTSCPSFAACWVAGPVGFPPEGGAFVSARRRRVTGRIPGTVR